ncbi:hypothetical protein [Streptomyces sp. SID8385]|uniref:hypothetical protein n=1 Tax=Streptomyces sp. SID8385 TaxID=2690364 RepID=UPI0010D6C1B3|nr:hypothetical protein [Streptomyces sp. SID8385]RZD70722.1 hypothetical protein C0Q61_31050 [Streptomyces albidoflavus]
METRSHTWTGISAGTLHLSTKNTAYPPVATARHPLAHRGRRDRCDKIATKPGCATYFLTRVMNFDEGPVTRGP